MATLCGLDWTIHVLWTNGETSGPQDPSPLIEKPLLLLFFYTSHKICQNLWCVIQINWKIKMATFKFKV